MLHPLLFWAIYQLTVCGYQKEEGKRMEIYNIST